MKKNIYFFIIGLLSLYFLTGCLFFKSPAQSQDLSSSSVESSITSSSEIDSIEEKSTLSVISNVSETNVIEGIFTGVEWGDYLHLELKDDEGVIHSFFVLRLTEDSVDVQALEEGQRIKIEWETSIEYLDPPGENIEIDQVTFIALLEG